VTGLSISDAAQPHVPRKKKRRLRQELHYAEKYGLGDHFLRMGVNDGDVAQQEINRLDGLVKFVAYHEPRLSAQIKPQWTTILREAGERPSYTPRHQDRSAFSISVDEAEFQGPSGLVLALGLCVTQHQGRLHLATQEVLDEALADPFAAGDREAALRRGLHFADVTEDVRLRYVERLQALPFEGYVAYARLASPGLYEVTYLRLLGAIVKRRLMAAESQLASFVIEKNGKVTEAKIQEVIYGALAELKAENNRRPQNVMVSFVDKPDLYISAPDFMLGVLGKYLRSTDPEPGRLYTLQTREAELGSAITWAR
jgi:RNA-directed DNA polymerase